MFGLVGNWWIQSNILGDSEVYSGLSLPDSPIIVKRTTEVKTDKLKYAFDLYSLKEYQKSHDELYSIFLESGDSIALNYAILSLVGLNKNAKAIELCHKHEEFLNKELISNYLNYE